MLSRPNREIEYPRTSVPKRVLGCFKVGSVANLQVMLTFVVITELNRDYFLFTLGKVTRILLVESGILGLWNL